MNWKNWSILALSVLTAGASAPMAQAQDDHSGAGDHGRRSSVVTVAFGAGLNTGGGAANQHILPPVINVRAGVIVNFVVAGFHQVFVYPDGVTHDDIEVPEMGQFIDFAVENLFYQGLRPGMPEPPDGFAHANNRVESVAFNAPGVYLVICNVRTHFNNGMFGYVVVEDEGGNEGRNHDQN